MRLIDADELKESLKDLKAEGYNQKYVKGIQDAIDYYFPQIIDDMPTVDVQPVKHGRWLDNGIVYTCSECNSSVPKNIFVIGCDFEGCPYCFARMGR